MPYGRLIFRVHAIRRMFERNISVRDIRHVLNGCDVIQTYPDDRPYPSYLVLGHVGGRPIHIVAADDQTEQVTFVITLYEPDPSQWDREFRRRKK